jgi:hypothetical protein
VRFSPQLHELLVEIQVWPGPIPFVDFGYSRIDGIYYKVYLCQLVLDHRNPGSSVSDLTAPASPTRRVRDRAFATRHPESACGRRFRAPIGASGASSSWPALCQRSQSFAVCYVGFLISATDHRQIHSLIEIKTYIHPRISLASPIHIYPGSIHRVDGKCA